MATFTALIEHDTGQTFPQDPGSSSISPSVRSSTRGMAHARSLPPSGTHSGRYGDGSQCHGHGVRQPRRRQWNWRRFTRDPASGHQGAYGDYLPNAQGEDVVAGTRNTLTLVT